MTAPDIGIHDIYSHSDMKHYLHKCTHCGYWNQMSYNDYNPDDVENSGNMRLMNPDGIDLLTRTVQDGTYQLVCQKCGKPLDRWYNGSWVQERTQNTDTSGYLITQMNAVWVE